LIEPKTKPPSGNVYSLPKSVKRSVGFARVINFHFRIYLLVVMIDEYKEEDETDEACRQFHQH
jgi:hypothetical protein